jgi:hypothetical protein
MYFPMYSGVVMVNQSAITVPGKTLVSSFAGVP